MAIAPEARIETVCRGSIVPEWHMKSVGGKRGTLIGIPPAWSRSPVSSQRPAPSVSADGLGKTLLLYAQCQSTVTALLPGSECHWARWEEGELRRDWGPPPHFEEVAATATNAAATVPPHPGLPPPLLPLQCRAATEASARFQGSSDPAATSITSSPLAMVHFITRSAYTELLLLARRPTLLGSANWCGTRGTVPRFDRCTEEIGFERCGLLKCPDVFICSSVSPSPCCCCAPLSQNIPSRVCKTISERGSTHAAAAKPALPPSASLSGSQCQRPHMVAAGSSISHMLFLKSSPFSVLGSRTVSWCVAGPEDEHECAGADRRELICVARVVICVADVSDPSGFRPERRAAKEQGLPLDSGFAPCHGGVGGADGAGVCDGERCHST
ncbi:unnamed protein product [Pleuronectes platessa]|uniref:Uncharacterized protein n=1 Tax=Pleuronectes platessa TaxID=8262 RepID=A0A9N7U5Z4_PLEPL|nr:unnamed protein product [Pleuronectes platessa]